MTSITWSNGPQGHSFVNVNDKNGLAAGSYALAIALDGVELASGTFTVGGGAAGAEDSGGGAPSADPALCSL